MNDSKTNVINEIHPIELIPGVYVLNPAYVSLVALTIFNALLLHDK